MTDTATLDSPRPGRRFPWRRFATDACWMLVLVVICAVVITWSFGDGTGFGINLLVSACIGTIAFAIIDGVRLAFWGEKVRPHWLAFAALIAVGVPVGQIAGARLAGWLLGRELTGLHTLGSSRTTGMLVFTLLATGAVTLFFASRDRLARAEAAAAEERARAEAVERQALQAQLQLLQAQIEPHMLFNTLANLQGLIALDPQRAQQMLDQLIQYLRATLSSSRAQRTTLAQEFALLEAYLGLMSVRMGARLSYGFDLPDALRAVEIPPMLLQPLVENAIAHGLEPTIDGGHIHVCARCEDKLLTLSVADNGRGLAAGPGKAGTSLGLSNTRARLDVLFGARASVTLQPADTGGAVARITIPLE
ncbi:histidine kinase [Pseudoduganella sp. SL102]|uniref:sensor histidine kinase n=1 Tax=Pseudoduganella sp. SL102 TaxID=2995154 RepID=UPI00248C2B0B|nr:histidine kinase [Pseudoduganella sp. SL102]WBS01441.1 histidine kinase [Pseudoduganella sp. SL102]